MSVVAKGADGKILVFVKGADSSLFKMSQQQCVSNLREDSNQMASRGLRTLVFGIRELSGTIDVDSLKPEDVEHSITLLGATAVEDLLQDDVQRCI